MKALTSPRARRRLGWLLMATGACGALLAGAVALAARTPQAHARASAAAGTPAASAHITVAHSHGSPPPMLMLRPRLAEGSVLAHLRLPGAAQPLTVLEGMPAQPGMLGHDTTTAYPGEPHSMLLVAGPGLHPAAPAAGQVIEVATGYGMARYRVTETHVAAAGSPVGPELPGVRLVVFTSAGEARVTTAELLPDSPDSAAELAQEAAVAQAQAALASQVGTVAPLPGHLLWPCSGPLTQGFGPTDLAMEFPYVYHGVQYAHFHTGVDIGVPLGTPITAAADGVVVLAGTNVVGGKVVGYGTYVVIAHGGGLSTLYGHLSQLAVSAGQHVRAGQAIGLSGSTGNSTGPHLHFEVREGYEPVDPLPFLRS